MASEKKLETAHARFVSKNRSLYNRCILGLYYLALRVKEDGPGCKVHVKRNGEIYV